MLEEVGKVAVSSRNEKPGLCLSLDWNRDRYMYIVHILSWHSAVCT